MRRIITTLAVGVMLAAGLAGCGDDAGETGGSNAPIEVTFDGDEVTPKGERLQVNQGTVTFEVTADQPGTIHVHTSPEQEFDYESGTHDYAVALDTPGVVEVESHDLDLVMLQLEVR